MVLDPSPPPLATGKLTTYLDINEVIVDPDAKLLRPIHTIPKLFHTILFFFLSFLGCENQLDHWSRGVVSTRQNTEDPRDCSRADLVLRPNLLVGKTVDNIYGLACIVGLTNSNEVSLTTKKCGAQSKIGGAVVHILR